MSWILPQDYWHFIEADRVAQGFHIGSGVCGYSSKDGVLRLALFTVATGSLDPTDQQCGAPAHSSRRVQDRCEV